MTFMKMYGFSAVGFNLMMGAFGIQWALLMQGWFHTFVSGKIYISVTSLIKADLCVASVCISSGALLGKISPVQVMLMTLFQVTLFSVNEYILLNLLNVNDTGGSMRIHVFGAYFGLTVSWILCRPHLKQKNKNQGSDYRSDLFAIFGTLFLWIYWPSFNSATSGFGDGQHRAAINTYCALAACVLSAVGMSSLLNKNGKLEMVHIQNATIVGGISIGTAAEMCLTPYGALIVGFLTGIIADLGFAYLTPFLSSKLHLHDTCGIHNLHGMPGLIGGIVGAVTAAAASPEVYTREGLIDLFNWKGKYADRTPSIQGGYQAAGICVSLAMAIVGGALVGVFLRLPIWGDPADENCFDDSVYWELPEEVNEPNESSNHYVTHLPE